VEQICGHSVFNSGYKVRNYAEHGRCTMRKLILGTVSVLALGIGGAALDYVANADDAVPSAEGNTPSTPGTSPHWINTTNLSKDDVR
jgi:hypothetical protein